MEVAPYVNDRLVEARQVVDAAVAGDEPVYGLNTGLGSKVGVKIPPEEIAAHQRRIIEGRATAVGPKLAGGTGRSMLLSRLVTAAVGASGMSPSLFDHLLELFNERADPGVPRWGSIGSSDLAQNAVWALPIIDAPDAPTLCPKDGLALISHNALTVAVSAQALDNARRALNAVKRAALLSFTGYHANPAIFDAAIHDLRPAPGQSQAAAWFREHLRGTVYKPTRVQDALSFRTLAPLLGAAEDALSRAIAVWEDEANGSPDSPAVIGGELVSTPNFQTPALALAINHVSVALAQVATSSNERFARLLVSELSGLPKDLSPVGGAAAGFVPGQKAAASLLAQVRTAAMPVHDTPPIAHSVEDVAPMTPHSAYGLEQVAECLALLAGIEGRAGLQAHHLRCVDDVGSGLYAILEPASVLFSGLVDDRPLGPEFEAMANFLMEMDD